MNKLAETWKYVKTHWDGTITKLTLLGLLCLGCGGGMVYLEHFIANRHGLLFYLNCGFVLYWLYQIPATIIHFLKMNKILADLKVEYEDLVKKAFGPDADPDDDDENMFRHLDPAKVEKFIKGDKP
jgi:hypothetical protein